MEEVKEKIKQIIDESETYGEAILKMGEISELKELLKDVKIEDYKDVDISDSRYMFKLVLDIIKGGIE